MLLVMSRYLNLEPVAVTLRSHHSSAMGKLEEKFEAVGQQASQGCGVYILT